MRLSDYRVLTFDCYGTLIDWESGIHAALQPLLTQQPQIGRDQALERFAQHESTLEAEAPATLYSDVLEQVYQRLADEWGVRASAEDCARFGASVGDWPAFPDSSDALRYLKQHYQLVILSNVHRAGFAASNAKLGVEFDMICTAQDIGSYKPSSRNFEYMLARLTERGIDKAHVLHTAQSLFHDHAPAAQAGLASAWIDRRHNAAGWGATMPPPEDARYDFRFDSMAALVRAHQEDARA